MIDLQKLIADCDFHIKRGDNMVMPPKLLKELAERLIDDDEEFEQVQTDRDFETEQVEAAKALQPAPDVQELITALSILSRWVDQNCEDPACTLPLKLATETLAKHGGING